MRAKKWVIIATVIFTIISIVLLIICGCNDIKIGYDIALAVFGSSLLGFIMSMMEYFSERKSAMEKFWLEATKVLIQFRKAKPVVLSEPEELVLNSLAEDSNNRQVEEYGVIIASSLGFKKNDKAQEAYIAWLEEHEAMSFSENDNISEILNKIYKKHLEQNRDHLISIINNYIELSQISLSDLDSAYGNLDFLFGNKTIRRKAYDDIFNKIREIRNSICVESYHFNLWREGKGNFVVCAEKAIDVSKTLFKSIISETNGLKQECIYQVIFDEIQESLEDFRVKIYWSREKEPTKRIPVRGRIISLEEDQQSSKLEV